MPYPSDLLVEEHKLIERMLVVLDNIADLLQKGQSVPAEVLEKAVDFIRNFADKYHHGKEEDILFKLMEKRGIPVEGGPIGAMLHEHNMGRSFVSALADAADRLEDGDDSARNIVIENIRNFTELLSNHIHKENNILYPMGNQIFSPEDQNYLQQEFEQFNQSKGQDVHDRYSQVVQELEATYK